jgi:hypothetical protein
VIDTLRPPYHPGKYTYHPVGCTCSITDVGENSSLSPRRIRRAVTSLDRKPCNPGGFIWSCCNAQTNEAEGCAFFTRFVYTQHTLEQCTLLPVHDSPLVFVANEGNYACHTNVRMNVTRVNVFGSTAVKLNRPRQRAVAFEIMIDECATSTMAAERMVVGVVADSDDIEEILRGSFISGKHGIGWWSNGPMVRGMDRDTEFTTDVGSRGYGAGDLVSVVLDGVNEEISFFVNRQFAGSTRLEKLHRYRLAITMVKGSKVSVDYTYPRTHLNYVDYHMKKRAQHVRDEVHKKISAVDFFAKLPVDPDLSNYFVDQ